MSLAPSLKLDSLRTLPTDSARQIQWRFADRYGWARGKADVLYVADAFQLMEKINALLAERSAELQAK